MSGMLILNMIVPFIMVLVGFIMKKCPVSDMRSQNGYNTPVARRSQAHWDYAQKIAPDIFLMLGIGLFVVEAVISVVFRMLRISVVISVIAGTCIGFLGLFAGFLYTDSKIKEFMDGQRG